MGNLLPKLITYWTYYFIKKKSVLSQILDALKFPIDNSIEIANVNKDDHNQYRKSKVMSVDL